MPATMAEIATHLLLIGVPASIVSKFFKKDVRLRVHHCPRAAAARSRRTASCLSAADVSLL